MSGFDKHVFVCCNQRDCGDACCNNHGASKLLSYMKDKVKAMGLTKDDALRINKAGCLGRCDDGPIMVVYPEAVWYTYIDETDIDEIIEKHLVEGQIVERLKV